MPSPSADRTSHTSRKRRLFSDSLLFLALLASACGPTGEVRQTAPAAGVRIDGLVSRAGRSFDGAQVLLYPMDALAAGDNLPVPAVSALSAEGGRFTLDAAPGQYLLIARAPGLFAWFGRNPLRATANQRGISLPLVPAHALAEEAAAPGTEGVGGRLLREGAPVAGAQVFAYLEADRGLKGTPYAISQLTGEDGVYRLDLEPGRYFLAARLRDDPQRRGPMDTGDLFGVLPELPLKLRAGQAAAVDIELVEIPSHERMGRYATRFAKLTGLVTDASGTPLAGFRACLYDTPRMIDEPLEVSDPTGPDGRFTLSSTRSGTFWLGAREKLGGPPQSGERIGFAQGGRPVDLSPGVERRELRVVVQAVP